MAGISRCDAAKSRDNLCAAQKYEIGRFPRLRTPLPIDPIDADLHPEHRRSAPAAPIPRRGLVEQRQVEIANWIDGPPAAVERCERGKIGQPRETGLRAIPGGEGELPVAAPAGRNVGERSLIYLGIPTNEGTDPGELTIERYEVVE